MTKHALFRTAPRSAISFHRPRLAGRSSLAALALLQLLGGVGCESLLHIGRLADKARDGGASALDLGGSVPDGRYVPDATPDAMPAVRPLPPPHPPLTSAAKVDMLFVIDDSVSMAPLQEKMRTRLPDFMNVLKSIPGGLPDLHIAVVSTSLGAGRFGNVPGCAVGTTGNRDGEFQRPASCTGLLAGETFIKSTYDSTGARVANFTGDLTETFRCLANLGDQGCGFEQPFEATRLALTRATGPDGPNAGFLRPDAYLAVVMLANEDDCSVPPSSPLFDPAQQSISEPYGGLQSYRCSEFGHLCDGQAPPHAAPGTPVTLANCVSNEDGPLLSVRGFTDFLFTLKPGAPEKIFVGAIAGPTTPYVVAPRQFMLATGGTEMQPVVQHSCTSGTGGSEFADPAVRIKQWTSAFGPNSFFGSICAFDFGPTMTALAQTMVAPGMVVSP